MRVNLIHLKLILLKNKKKNYCSREQCEWNQFTAFVFWKKKTIHFNEQCDNEAWLHCSVIPPPREAIKLCFYKTCGTTIFLVGPTSINLCFFFNQKVISVAAGEVHPQPHYQTAASQLETCLKLYFLLI